MQTLAVGDMKYMAFISGTGSLLLNRSSTTEEIKGWFNQSSYRHRQTHLSWLGHYIMYDWKQSLLVIFSDIRSDILQHDERSLVVNESRIIICKEEWSR